MALFCVLPMIFQKTLCTMVPCVTAVVFSGCLFFGFGFGFFYNILQHTQCLMQARVYNDVFQTSWVSRHRGSERSVSNQNSQSAPLASLELTEVLLRGFLCSIHKGVPLVKAQINCQNQAKWGLEWPLNKKTFSLWEWVLSVVNKSHRIKPVDSEK